MGPEGAVNIVYRKELQKASDPEEKRKDLVNEYKTLFANPYIAAEMGFVDEIIAPSTTRKKLISVLDSLSTKREGLPPKKHSSIPL